MYILFTRVNALKLLINAAFIYEDFRKENLVQLGNLNHPNSISAKKRDFVSIYVPFSVSHNLDK